MYKVTQKLILLFYLVIFKMGECFVIVSMKKCFSFPI